VSSCRSHSEMECPSISNSNEKQKPVDKKIDPQLIRKGDSRWKTNLLRFFTFCVV
jgi:hypothetical protein